MTDEYIVEGDPWGPYYQTPGKCLLCGKALSTRNGYPTDAGQTAVAVHAPGDATPLAAVCALCAWRHRHQPGTDRKVSDAMARRGPA